MSDDNVVVGVGDDSVVIDSGVGGVSGVVVVVSGGTGISLVGWSDGSVYNVVVTSKLKWFVFERNEVRVTVISVCSKLVTVVTVTRTVRGEDYRRYFALF